jgi:hypothetical protein
MGFLQPLHGLPDIKWAQYPVGVLQPGFVINISQNTMLG